MVQAGGVPGLGVEPGAEGGVVGVLALEDLDRDLAAEHRVASRARPRPSRRWRCARRARSARRVAGRRLEVVAHLPITASMTDFAIGAARPLPEICVAGDAGVLDQHRDRDLGVVGRGERDEPGVRRPVGRALRGAGLAGHLDARDLRGLCRCRSSTTATIIWVRSRRGRGAASRAGRAAARGRSCAMHVELGRLDLVDQVGLHHRRRRWRCRRRPSPSAAGWRPRRTGRSPRAPSAARRGPSGNWLTACRVSASSRSWK